VLSLLVRGLLFYVQCFIAAELTTNSGSEVATSEANGTSVTMAANDAITSSSVYDGVSTEGSTQQLTQETSSSLPQNVEQLNNVSSTQNTEHGTTTDLEATRPTASEADTTTKEQTQSTANVMSSQQTSTSELTTTVSQSTMTSPSSPDVHCCCRCCFPSTPTCTFCDGDSLTDASECANKEPATIKPVDRSKPKFEAPPALQGSKHPERLAYNEEFLKSEKLTETLAALPESQKIELGFKSSDLIVDCSYDGSPCYVKRSVLVVVVQFK